MEREFQFQFQFQPVVAGGEVYHAAKFSPAVSVEDAYINGVYNKYNGVLSFQPLSNEGSLYQMAQPNEPPLAYDAFYEMLSPLPAPVTYSFFDEKFPALGENSDDVLMQEMPKVVKNEPINFFAGTATTTTAATASQLPSVLHSFTGPAAVQNLHFHVGSSTCPYKPSPSAARRRRKKISEKVRCLEKLLPWDKKMYMGTMLEETCKYVKFLEAQVSVLQSMPLLDAAAEAAASSSSSASSTLSVVDISPPSAEAALRNLNRQQLLEIVVNSREAQTLLMSKGCCVFSVEQLILLNDAAQKRSSFPTIFV